MNESRQDPAVQTPAPLDSPNAITHAALGLPAEATLTRSDGNWVLTMRRTLRHRPEVIWPKLVYPDELLRWSPFIPDRVLDGRGPATARENPEDDAMDAEVLVVDPPRELIHRWGDDLLRWTLEPTVGGSILVLEHRFADREIGTEVAAGWHLCIAVLTLALDDQPVGRVVGENSMRFGWPELETRYRALFA